MPICCQQLFSNFFKFFRCPAAPLCGDSFVILALFFAYVNIYFQIFSKKYSNFSCFFDCSYCITAKSIEITCFYTHYEYPVNTPSSIYSWNVGILPMEFFSDRRRFIKSLYICSFFKYVSPSIHQSRHKSSLFQVKIMYTLFITWQSFNTKL